MFDLEPTDDLAQPAFRDAASCTEWLSQLQLTNLNLAQGTLRKEIGEFNRCALRGGDRLQTMEALRETVAIVQTDFSRKLVGKKLPLADDEFMLLLALAGLWQSMEAGYLRCLQMAEAGDRQLASQRALLGHRCVHYSGQTLNEFLRAGYEPDNKWWRHFHELYAHLEARGIHQQAVTDPYSRSGQGVSCRTLYATALLMHRARLVLSRGQWHVAERWLEQWGDSALTVEPRCSMSKGDAPPLAVDLAGEHGLFPIQQATAAASMRFLAMVPLSKQIRVKTILLQQGQTPQQAGLGGETSSKECIALLGELHRCWCEARAESLADAPRTEAATVQLCAGLENAYAFIARKPFKPVKDAARAKQDAQKQIETFGRVLDETGQHTLTELGFVPEEWQVEENGLLHARLLRKANAGERLAANQLVSVVSADGAALKLGVIGMVSVTRHHHLYITVHFLPGQPQALVVRGNAEEGSLLLSGSAPALLLPALEKLKIPASLILPRDWFHAERKLEFTLPDHSKQSIVLGFSVTKGSDYERVSFKPA